MAPATASPRSEPGDPARRWSDQVSLTPRILAVNVFALLLLGGGFFYLDSFRTRILDSRVMQVRREAGLMAEALNAAPPASRPAVLTRLARDTGGRLQLLDRSDRVLMDSERLGGSDFTLVDPRTDGLGQRAARWLDALIDFIVRAPSSPAFQGDPSRSQVDPGIARTTRTLSATVWRAPDRTPVITAAAPLPGGSVVLSTINARDITERVRVERYRLSLVVLTALAISVALSLYLARTIVDPLRRLARAAVRVRLGRAREVVVPRLPERRDEIGMLARALSDMSLALRARIDATEAFAADVTHELKNPLASLRSAVDSLTLIDDRDAQARLLAIVADDVHRLDRLISDISEASRLDAQLSRAKFERIDLIAMIASQIAQREQRGTVRGIRLHLDLLPDAQVPVMAEGARLERVFDNLIDNALSFSPDGGIVSIAVRRVDEDIEVRVEDEGPGVPAEAREAIFRRFHSVRPSEEAFGKHSGLGLAIARTIVEAHQGSVAVESREDRLSGARFVVRLPIADAVEPA
ncbi:sensor N-terminal transmembrane domain-containing protein [Sphingomonas sp. HHU CXW]|uniref:histidine kinase n=1 Tax=Sphingomonas hominis TaxID=2741495 RepID=A0ABX2JH05_9SPHN|nr:ATP-binding protein [Sphingomonas hominis]NTS65781.1 sensor N-terminal transmembrane domain-containing protein [Sphingomonas hominis]